MKLTRKIARKITRHKKAVEHLSAFFEDWDKVPFDDQNTILQLWRETLADAPEDFKTMFTAKAWDWAHEGPWRKIAKKEGIIGSRGRASSQRRK